MAKPSKYGDAPVNKVFAACLVLSGFALSVGLVNLTKWIYVQHRFAHPLFLTGTHMIMSFLFASTMVFVFGAVPDRPILSWRQSVLLVGPFSVAGAASLASANIAMVMLFPSFHAMLQDSTPFWTVLCAMVFSGKRYNTAAYLALVPVCGGAAICAWGEQSDFRWLGVVFSLSSAALRGLKVVLQGILLKGHDFRLDSLSLLYYSSPLNIALFLAASAWSEGLAPWADYVELPISGQACVWTAAATAGVFNIVCFYAIGYLGPIVAMVVGNLKAPTIILVCHLTFGNPVSFQQIVGSCVVVLGVIAYDRLGREVPASARTQQDAGGSGGRKPYLAMEGTKKEDTGSVLEAMEGTEKEDAGRDLEALPGNGGHGARGRRE